MGFFDKMKAGLQKTRESMVGKVETLLGVFTKIDEDFFEQLEETLVMSDVGAVTAADICEQLRSLVKKTATTDPQAVKGLLQQIIADMLREGEALSLTTKPSLVLVIGVNGAGKTTTVGKMAAYFKGKGKRVIVGAADTFRAAAIEQLAVWTDRAGVELIKQKEGFDPTAVIYDTIQAGKARGCDIILCDTAGRLHNKKYLMEELAKISRIIDRELPDCDKEILLVLDATTGQNALNQAKLFGEVTNITGIVLTKLDGTARGGIVIAMKNELKLPVKFVGVGEKIDDLQPFVPEDFARALFDEF